MSNIFGLILNEDIVQKVLVAGSTYRSMFCPGRCLQKMEGLCSNLRKNRFPA